MEDVCQFKKWVPKRNSYQTCSLKVCKNEKNLKFCAHHLPVNEGSSILDYKQF